MAREGTCDDFERFVAPALVETLGKREDAQLVAVSLALLLRDFVMYTALQSVYPEGRDDPDEVRPVILNMWREFLEFRES